MTFGKIFSVTALVWGMSAYLALTTCGPAVAQTQSTDSRTGLLSKLSNSLDELSQRVSPAIVRIEVTGFHSVSDQNPNDTSLVARGQTIGSGVIVDPDGYIITNAHVVKGAQRVRVILTAASVGSQVKASLGREDHIAPIEATIVGVASTLDLALLKIDSKNLPVLPFADYNALKKGEIVLAFGNPEGFENSVSMGVVSAVAREVLPNVPSVFIQTDAPINPGNSGGPLVDTDGKIVGINTFILTQSGGNQGLGFAIPSSVVEFAYRELRQFGHIHHVMIGVDLQEITPDLAEGLNLPQQDGVIISDVEPGGPAEKAGLRPQDILQTLKGRSLGSVPLTEMIIATSAADDVLEATVLRDDRKLTFEIPVKEERSGVDQLTDLSDPSKLLIRRMGIFGVTIDDKLAAQMPDLRRPSGVIVAALAAAGTMGPQTDLQQGDVIHALNGKPISMLDDLRKILDTMPSGAPGVLQIERDGKLLYSTFEME